MNKKFQIFALAALLIGAPLAATAEVDRDVDTELSAVTLTVNGTTLRIGNASGMDVCIYNLAGIKVSTIHIDSNDKTINLNLQKGCYLVRVGKVTRKISIR